MSYSHLLDTLACAFARPLHRRARAAVIATPRPNCTTIGQRLLRCVLSTALAVALASSVVAQVVKVQYVSQGAPGLDNGDSWTDAFTTLERALDPSTNAELLAGNSVELRLRNDTYVPDGTLRFPSGSADPRHGCFLVTDNTHVRGGWSGSELPTDPPTGGYAILCGDMGTADDMTDNNYHVVVMQTLLAAEQVQLESVKVVDGFADGALLAGSLTNDSSGGGILINSAFALLTDVVVMDCFGRFGGGIAALHDPLVR